MSNQILFQFEALPKNLEELKRLKESSLKTPFETAALTVLSLLRYSEDSKDAIEMLNYLRGPRPLSNYDIQFIKDRFRDKDYVPKSYFEGTSPQNSYELAPPYKITVYEDKYSYDQEGYAKLYLKSSGADSPRPVVLRIKGDTWYLWEQLLLAGIREPVSLDPWA